MASSIINLDDLLRECDLNVDALDQEIIPRHFQEIACCLSGWKYVALKLPNFDESEVEAIEYDNRFEDGKRIGFLRLLKQKLSFRATYKLLVKRLLEIGRAEDARRLCQIVSGFKLPSCESSENVDQKFTRESTLLKEVLILQRKFEDLVEYIQSSLTKRNISYSRIRSSLKFISEAEKILLHSHPKNRSNLFDVKSMEELFFIFSEIWDYLHPGLLDFIVNRFGTEDDKVKMENYLRVLYRFRREVKIGVFIQAVYNIPSDYSVLNKEVTTVMEEGWEHKTLQDVENYRLAMVNKINCEDFLVKAIPKRSSIAINFAMPTWIHLDMADMFLLFCFYGTEKVYLNEDYIYDCTRIMVHISYLNKRELLKTIDIMELLVVLSKKLSQHEISHLIKSNGLPFPLFKPDALKVLFHLSAQRLKGELSLLELQVAFDSVGRFDLSKDITEYVSVGSNMPMYEKRNQQKVSCTGGRNEFGVLLYELSQRLSEEEIVAIIFIEDLPKEFMGKKSLEVLIELQMSGKISESDPSTLQSVLRNINRMDLVDKVKNFVKSQKKKMKKSHKAGLGDRLDKMVYDLEANLTVVHIQAKVLQEQLINVATVADKCGDAKMERKLQESIWALHNEIEHNITCVRNELDKKERKSLQKEVLHKEITDSAHHNIREESHQDDEGEGLYDYISSTHRISFPFPTLPISDEVYTAVPNTVGTEGTSPKSIVMPLKYPPKPSIKATPREYSDKYTEDSSVDDCSYTGSTGDSGFVDPIQFRRKPVPHPTPLSAGIDKGDIVKSPPKPAPRPLSRPNSYTKLNTEELKEATYYMQIGDDNQRNKNIKSEDGEKYEVVEQPLYENS